MKRLIITSSFPGEVIAVYGDDKLLISVDYGGAELNEKQITYLLRNIPSIFDPDNLKLFAHVARLNIDQENTDITFEMFWERYKKKINKDRCRDDWKKMSNREKVRAYKGVISYESYLRRVKWRSKADPENYLKKKMWNNDWEQA